MLGASRNVHAALNRARFELGMGKYADRVLQAAWNRSGADGLRFDVLELVKEREDANFDYAAELKAVLPRPGGLAAMNHPARLRGPSTRAA